MHLVSGALKPGRSKPVRNKRAADRADIWAADRSDVWAADRADFWAADRAGGLI